MDWDRATSLIDVVSKEFIEHVTFFTSKQLCRLLILALLDDSLVQKVNLLIANVQISFNLSQVSFTSLHKLIKLIYIFNKHVFLVLHVANLLLISL